MEIYKLLRINQLINIEIIHENEEKSRRYPSRVENLDTESGTLWLATPFQDRLPVFIPPGTELKVWFWDAAAMYSMTATLLQNKVGDLYQIIVLYQPETIQRVQNRQFVRVNFVSDVLVSNLSPDGDQEQIVCQSKDLSGGGISLVNMGKKVYFEEESTISMQFTIGDLHLDLMGIVIWVKQMKYDDMDRVTTGVNFTCISEDTRKEIIKRVYLRQIELRKKGVL